MYKRQGERRAGTVGLPLPGVELKITDPETTKELSIDEIGQIEVRGPNVFKGYWKMPEKTEAELRKNGFFITGDLGKIDVAFVMPYLTGIFPAYYKMPRKKMVMLGKKKKQSSLNYCFNVSKNLKAQ